MRLNLFHFYMRDLKARMIFLVPIVAVLAILKFFLWPTVETVMGANGTIGDWILLIFSRLLAILTALAAIVLLSSPYREYKEYRSSIRYAARITHWEGALAKAMRDFGKSLKDGNETGIDSAAKILLKEIQVQCTYGTSMREIRTKLEGVCEGILIGLPEQLAEHIELQLVVRTEDLYEFLQLNVGDRKYKRSLQYAA